MKPSTRYSIGLCGRVKDDRAWALPSWSSQYSERENMGKNKQFMVESTFQFHEGNTSALRVILLPHWCLQVWALKWQS